MINYAILTGLYGLVLTILVMFWLRRCGVPWRSVACVIVFFLLAPLLMLPAGFAAAILNFAVPLPLEIWAVPIEEAVKLAAIVRLGARGRTVVMLGLLFGCVEIVTSKALIALVTPLPALWPWMLSITGVVLMHGATGVVYAGIGRVRRWQLFLVAISLHLANNLGALWIGGHTDTVLQVLVMQASIVAAVGAAAILFREWTLGRSFAVAPFDDGDGLAAGAPFV